MPLVEVPVNCSPELGDECECKSDPWHRVLLLVLCCTATRLLLLQNTSDLWHSVPLLVLCVHPQEWLWRSRVSCRRYFWKYRRPAFMVKSAVPLLTNCMLWQAMQICTRVQQLCIWLNSSKIHTSNNNLATCAAPFIPPHSSQLWIQRAYQLPQPRIQYPLSFEYFTCGTLSARMLFLLQQ